MKKLLIAFVLLISLLGIAVADTVEDLNGFDWVTWTIDQKVGYLFGFYSAYSSVWERFIFESGGNQTEEEMDRLEEYFYFRLDIYTLGERIDNYYSNYKNRNDKLYVVIMFLSGKDYWSSPEYQGESDSNRT